MAVLERIIVNGAARRLDRILQPFDAAAEYVSAHHGELLAQFEEQWVAVGSKGVVASSRTQRGLRQALQRRGAPANTLYVTFLTRKRQTLIL
jgi:hypothetical protein